MTNAYYPAALSRHNLLHLPQPNCPAPISMASDSSTPVSRAVIILAAVAVFLQALAWQWAMGSNPGLAWPPVLLGVVGMGLSMLAIGLFATAYLRQQARLHKANQAATKAFEHERAMERAQLYANRTRELLTAALDAIPIGIAIYDPHDRQVIRNRSLGDLFPGLFKDDANGEAYESVLQRMLDMVFFADVDGTPQVWLENRLAKRTDDGQPTLQHYANDRWIQTYEIRTPQSYCVVAWVEVTDLVRKERLLALANAKLSRQSATDGLTGIANRRKFDDTLAVEWQRAARSGTPLSLLMVDIDHFKRFNDHYGHVAGDECLRQVTEILATCVRRAGELLARYGGEEFVLLLPGADLAHAEDLARRCLQRMDRRAIPHAASASGSVVTLSIGVAQVFPDASQTADSLVNAADTAMYRAKMDGRARYVVATEADWAIDPDAPRSRAAELQ